MKLHSLRMALLGACMLATACAGAPAATPSAQASLVEDGRQIATAQCAACHAVGEYGESPNPAAPVFRTLLGRYRPDVLEEELISGIRVAHAMPEFQFNPQGADALIAYLRAVQTPPPPR